MDVILFLCCYVVGYLVATYITKKRVVRKYERLLMDVKRDYLLLHFKVINFKNNIQKELINLPEDLRLRLGEIIEDFERKIKD